MRFARQGRLEEMLATIEMEFRLTAAATGRERLQPRIRDAFAAVPREHFVPADMQRQAFANSPLPIGDGQTISQPFIVALMTDLLDPRPEQRILEIGTGSGYQTAILAELAGEVYSIECLAGLSKRAQQQLAQEGYGNIVFRTGDGYVGWPDAAPFDGIIVTAAASHVPEPLKEQLADGGRLVIPVGPPGLHQELLLIEREQDHFHTRSILGVAFVPLVRGR